MQFFYFLYIYSPSCPSKLKDMLNSQMLQRDIVKIKCEMTWDWITL